MKACINNQLFVAENDSMRIYRLDDKRQWLLGRQYGTERPDICMSSPTVSRKHGMFYNEEGIWFFRNLSMTNGTYYIQGNKRKSIMKIDKDRVLSDGDVLLPGNSGVESDGTFAWIMFSTFDYGDERDTIDTSEYNSFLFYDEEKQVELDCPKPGTMIRFSKGIAVYMGNTTYLIGAVRVKLQR